MAVRHGAGPGFPAANPGMPELPSWERTPTARVTVMEFHHSVISGGRAPFGYAGACVSTQARRMARPERRGRDPRHAGTASRRRDTSGGHRCTAPVQQAGVICVQQLCLVVPQTGDPIDGRQRSVSHIVPVRRRTCWVVTILRRRCAVCHRLARSRPVQSGHDATRYVPDMQCPSTAVPAAVPPLPASAAACGGAGCAATAGRAPIHFTSLGVAPGLAPHPPPAAPAIVQNRLVTPVTRRIDRLCVTSARLNVLSRCRGRSAERADHAVPSLSDHLPHHGRWHDD